MARIVRSRGFLALSGLVVILLAAVGLTAVRAQPAPDLPQVAPDRLIASALQAIAARTPVSGTVQTHVDLGLPQIPASLAGSGLGPLDVLLSAQTFRVWRSPDGVRVAQILPTAERVLVANGSDLWAWDSARFTAWHVALPSAPPMPAPPSLADLTTIVGRVLEGIAPYAHVAVGEPMSVAGRDAYTLELTPTADTTLVGTIQIAIDAETSVPLRLRVIPKGSLDPSIEVGYTSVGFAPIDPGMFSFTPPPGATVKQIDTSAHGMEPTTTQPPEMPEVRTFGEGFGLILAVRVPAERVPSEVRTLLPFSGPLGSADLVPRGDHAWVVAGAVPPGALAEVEPQLP
jgi:outer membrane lipoprotein-sorting protein